MMTVIQMQETSSSLDTARICDSLERQGCQARVVPRASAPCVVVSGKIADKAALRALPGVGLVSETNSSFPLASREAGLSEPGPMNIAPGVSPNAGNKKAKAVRKSTLVRHCPAGLGSPA